MSDDPFPNVIGTFMGRDALSLLISALQLRSSDAVLLPAYLCREVSKPFVNNTQLDFYDLSRDLVVDPGRIKDRLQATHFKLVYIINYFGFLQPHRSEIKTICADRGVILVEDCAHSLLTQGSGETGDAIIFSFRKVLPLPDGGGLKMSTDIEAPTRFHPLLYSNVLSLLSLAKSRLRFRSELLSRSGLSAQVASRQQDAQSLAKPAMTLPMSSYTKRALRKFDFSEIIARRRTDFDFWRGLAARTDMFRPLFANMPPEVCPLGFPVIANDRPSLETYLRRRGVHLRIHWPLPSEVGDRFVESHRISSQICTLPVYPDLSPREREVYLELFGSS